MEDRFVLGWVHLHKAAVVDAEAKEGQRIGMKQLSSHDPASANHAFKGK